MNSIGRVTNTRRSKNNIELCKVYRKWRNVPWLSRPVWMALILLRNIYIWGYSTCSSLYLHLDRNSSEWFYFSSSILRDILNLSASSCNQEGPHGCHCWASGPGQPSFMSLCGPVSPSGDVVRGSRTEQLYRYLSNFQCKGGNIWVLPICQEEHKLQLSRDRCVSQYFLLSSNNTNQFQTWQATTLDVTLAENLDQWLAPDPFK